MKMDDVNSFTGLMPSYAQPGAGDGPGSASFSDALAQAVAQMEQAKAASSAGAEEEQEEPSLIERINDKGFVAFAEELQEEKLKELRKKLLEAMGYSEEDLNAMSPDQRAEIEKIVDNEILKRMMANAALNNQGQGKELVGIVQKTEINVRVTTVSMHSATLQSNAFAPGQMGLGPLLAHQEVADEQAGRSDDKTGHDVGKKDREKLV